MTKNILRGIKAITGKNPLVEYVRDEKDNRPVGVIVAIDRENIGWFKGKKNKRWLYESGVMFAFHRALNGEGYDTIPENFDNIRSAYQHMEARARSYYTTEKPHKPRAVVVAGRVRE